MRDGTSERTKPKLRRSRISELGRSQRLRIIHLLKKTRGLAVTEIANRLGLGYIGAKQHCAEMEKQGLLDTLRRPKPGVRPELVYRIKPKAGVLFPVDTNLIEIEILHSAPPP